MSWLFLLMIPPVALASFRLLASHIANAAAAVVAIVVSVAVVTIAAVVAVVVAVAATVLPAWALRTKPSHGSPVETPVGPAFRGGRAELLVDYVSGWSQPAQRAGQTVRLLSGHGELAVGPLQSRRPRATLSFRASAAAATTVVVRYGDAVVERARVATAPSLASRVRLVGAVPHDRLPAFYSAADLFVLGSHHEGSGYAVIEALACGAVPVVTDIPTFRLLTARGSFGALWPAGDAAACAAAMAAVAARPLADERRRALDHFAREVSWRAIGRRALAIYADVVDARRRR
jgi:hypothetical protein